MFDQQSQPARAGRAGRAATGVSLTGLRHEGASDSPRGTDERERRLWRAQRATGRRAGPQEASGACHPQITTATLSDPPNRTLVDERARTARALAVARGPLSNTVRDVDERPRAGRGRSNPRHLCRLEAKTQTEPRSTSGHPTVSAVRSLKQSGRTENLKLSPYGVPASSRAGRC